MNRVSVENPDNDDDRIYLTRPVTPDRLRLLLGIKLHEMLAKLMARNVFALRDEVIPDSAAKDVAQKHHRILIIRDEEPEY
jgi:hypothetical protein